MAAMGLWHIGHPELWQDELVTSSVVRRSTAQIFKLLQDVDAVHGAYYLFLHRWQLIFGNSTASLRVPSAIAMVVATACVALIGQRLFSRLAGLLGGLVFVLIPATTRFAQEARSYAFVVMVAALATLVLLRALERPTVLHWATYALCITALVLLNAVATTIVAGHLVGILTSRHVRNWRILLTFGVAVVLGILPTYRLIYLGTQQATRQVSWIPHDAPWVVAPRTFASAWMGWAIIALAILACVRHRRRAVFPAAVAVVPLVAVGLASMGPLSYFFSKYLLFVVPLWAVLGGAGLTALRWKPLSVVGLAVLAVLALPGQLAMRATLSHSWYTYPDPESRTPMAYGEAAKIIAQNFHSGDGIVYQRGGYWWYMLDEGVSRHLPARMKPRDVFSDQTAAQRHALNAGECPVSVYCIGREPRVWVVVGERTDDPLSQLSPDQANTLRKSYVLLWTKHPTGITVGLLQLVK